MPFSLKEEDRKQYHIFYINGKFDLSNVQEIKKAVDRVIKSGQGQLLFEMRETTFVDSSAIGLLANTHKQLMAKGGGVSLAALSAVALKIFKSFKAERVFGIFDSVDAADSILNSGFCVEERGFYAYIKLPKEFNISTIGPLRDAINDSIEKGHTHVVFDFEQVHLINSIGLGIINNLHKKLKSRNGGIFLIGIQGEVRTFLETTNVLRMLPEYRSIEEVEDELI